MGLGRGALVEVTVGDDPDAWSAIGFAVGDDGVCRVGGVRMRLVGADGRRGLLGWTLAGDPTTGDPTTGDPTTGGTGDIRAREVDELRDCDVRDVDGLPTTVATGAATAGDAATTDHPNGATGLDHLVVVTPDLDRTTAALAALGIDARRTREAGRGRLQRFFRLGEVILEVVGPAEPSGGGPATFWGLAFTVADLEATAARLGDRTGPPRPAVQPGRRITTLRGGTGGGVSVPVAFMSPDTRGRPGGAPGQRL